MTFSNPTLIERIRLIFVPEESMSDVCAEMGLRIYYKELNGKKFITRIEI